MQNEMKIVIVIYLFIQQEFLSGIYNLIENINGENCGWRFEVELKMDKKFTKFDELRWNLVKNICMLNLCFLV